MQTGSPDSRVRCVHDGTMHLGEGPVFCPADDAVYWVDIKGNAIHRLGLADESHRSWTTPFAVSALAPRARGGFVAASARGFVLIDACIRDFDVIGHPEPTLPRNRFNDGKLDLKGRFWAGTMDDAEEAPTGSLYRLDADLRWSVQDHGYRVSNGPAFSPDGRWLYHADSADRVIHRMALREPEGDLAERGEFARFDARHGYPDGMTCDAEGCLWVAFWDGWCIRRLSPDGAILCEVRVPVARPTSCAFAGAGLDRLFVSSAGGPLFQLEPGPRGFATPAFPT